MFRRPTTQSTTISPRRCYLSSISETGRLHWSRPLPTVTKAKGVICFAAGVYSREMADWSTLPDDLLKLIAGWLHSIEDYIHFAAVCRSWHLVAVQKDTSSHPKLPWLMLTEGHSSHIRELYSPVSNRVYKLWLPECQGRRCWGTPFGWLVTVGTDFRLHLLNPLSRRQILLPPLQKCRNLSQLICGPREFRDVFLNKAVISSSPSSSDCVVMAVYLDYRKMAFLKLGDEAWTPLECSPRPIEDIMLFNGNFFAIDCSQNMLVFDSTGSHTRTIEFTSPPSIDELDYEAKYLIELKGEICMVVRCLYETRVTDTPCWRTWGFSVLKFDVCTENWKAVKSLDGCCLFLGNNNSFAVQASGCPGFRSGCIYFTDDYFGLYNTTSSYDMGIYSFEDHRIEPYPVEQPPLFVYSLPLWFKPSIN
ncbi:hypothetical protein Nepgr_012547 [Nepenthes gracilis]|uniref:Uncharacterized protein n=1 Tax=Nepenthes gracilis TaxID=150966 RepID=A0AAD3SHQ4_NEPGR|nr:hypothetical protein Nepgr_012547 [Nepenthes gracilis]